MWQHCTSLLIASTKKVLKYWLKPIDRDAFTNKNGVAHWLGNNNWFLSEAELVVTKNDSIDKGVVVKVIHHIYRHVRTTISPTEYIIIFLNGHGSKHGKSGWKRAKNFAIFR